MNQFVGWALAASAVVGILAFVIETGDPTDFTNFLFTIAGLGFYVFGIWGAVLLIRSK